MRRFPTAPRPCPPAISRYPSHCVAIRALALCVACVGASAALADAAAQTPRAATPPTGAVVTAARAPSPPRIDGRDDDPAWRSAAPAGDFRTFAPRESAAPAFRTEVRVLHDDRALYVLVRSFDPSPDSIVRPSPAAIHRAK